MKLGKLQAHLQKLYCDMTIIATDWFLCLFCTALPSEVSQALFSQHCFSPCCPTKEGQAPRAVDRPLRFDRESVL